MSRKTKKKTTEKTPKSAIGQWWERFTRFRQRRTLKKIGISHAREIRRILKKPGDLEDAVIRDCENALRTWKELLAEKAELQAAVGELSRLLDGPLKTRRRHPAWGYLFSFLIAASFALFLRAFVFEPFRIPSGSMIPSLQVGDYIYVNKFVYGLRIPFTSDPPRHFVTWSVPERGDVVVFIEPIHNSEDWIKRVIGLPGDTVRFRHRQISIRKKGSSSFEPILSRKLDQTCEYMDKNEKLREDWHPGKPCELYEERVGTRTWQVIYDLAPRQLPPDFPDEWEVPNHCVFVMGDNRDNSEDSRFLFRNHEPAPCVPLQNIKGRAEFIWLSSGPDGQRWNRIFRGVK